MRDAPRRGPVVTITAVASAVLLGTGTAHAVVSPPPGTAARPGAANPPTGASPWPRTANPPYGTAPWPRAPSAPSATAASPATGPGTRDTLATLATTVTRAMPRVYRLALRAQYQATNYYCVPASASMSLSTFGVTVSQATLAQKMRTTTRGTGGESAESVIDAYLKPRRYDDRIVGDVVGRPGLLMQRVSYDVGTLHRAPIIQVWMEKLPWNQARIGGRWIGHAIVAYGYDQRAGTITVFDPWRPSGGTHTLPASSLAMALQSGAGMHYIARA